MAQELPPGWAGWPRSTSNALPRGNLPPEAGWLLTGSVTSCLTREEWQLWFSKRTEEVILAANGWEALYISFSLAAAQDGHDYSWAKPKIRLLHRWYLKQATYNHRHALDLVKNLSAWSRFHAAESDESPIGFSDQFQLPQLELWRPGLMQFGLMGRALPEGDGLTCRDAIFNFIDAIGTMSYPTARSMLLATYFVRNLAGYLRQIGPIRETHWSLSGSGTLDFPRMEGGLAGEAIDGLNQFRDLPLRSIVEDGTTGDLFDGFGNKVIDNLLPDDPRLDRRIGSVWKADNDVGLEEQPGLAQLGMFWAVYQGFMEGFFSVSPKLTTSGDRFLDLSITGADLPCRIHAIPEEGWKARVVTISAGWFRILQHYARHELQGYLERDPRFRITFGGSTLWNFLENKDLSRKPWFASTDLKNATDLLPFELVSAVMDPFVTTLGSPPTRAICAAWLASRRTFFLPPTAFGREEPVEIRAGDVVHRRGVMMGEGLSFVALNLVSFAAVAISHANSSLIGWFPAHPSLEYPIQIAGDDIAAAYDSYEDACRLRNVLREDFQAVISPGKDLVSCHIGVFCEDHFVRVPDPDRGVGRQKWSFMDLIKLRILVKGTAAGQKTRGIPWIGQGRLLQNQIGYLEEGKESHRVASVARDLWRGKAREHFEAINDCLRPGQLCLPSTLGGLGQPDSRFIRLDDVLSGYVGLTTCGKVPEGLLKVQLELGVLGLMEDPLDHGIFVEQDEVLSHCQELFSLPIGNRGEADVLVDFSGLVRASTPWWQERRLIRDSGYVLLSDIVSKIQRYVSQKELLRGTRARGPSPFLLIRSIKRFNERLEDYDRLGLLEGFYMPGEFEAFSLRKWQKGAHWRHLAIHQESEFVLQLEEKLNFLYLTVPRR